MGYSDTHGQDAPQAPPISEVDPGSPCTIRCRLSESRSSATSAAQRYSCGRVGCPFLSSRVEGVARRQYEVPVSEEEG